MARVLKGMPERVAGRIQTKIFVKRKLRRGHKKRKKMWVVRDKGD